MILRQILLSMLEALPSFHHQGLFWLDPIMIGRHSSKQILAFWLLDNSLLEDFQGDPQSIVKIGEGTYSETFMAGKTVCKMVPIDGELLVNKEVQKMFSYFTLVASFFFPSYFLV